MPALLLKLAAWMGLWRAPSASVPNVAEPEPKPVPVTPPKPERRSARRTSPLTTRRGRRTGQSQRIVLAAAAKPPASKAARRPRSTPPTPKRTPPPRCVWLASRLPQAGPKLRRHGDRTPGPAPVQQPGAARARRCLTRTAHRGAALQLRVLHDQLGYSADGQIRRHGRRHAPAPRCLTSARQSRHTSRAAKAASTGMASGMWISPASIMVAASVHTAMMRL